MQICNREARRCPLSATGDELQPDLVGAEPLLQYPKMLTSSDLTSANLHHSAWARGISTTDEPAHATALQNMMHGELYDRQASDRGARALISTSVEAESRL